MTSIDRYTYGSQSTQGGFSCTSHLQQRKENRTQSLRPYAPLGTKIIDIDVTIKEDISKTSENIFSSNTENKSVFHVYGSPAESVELVQRRAT